MPGITPFNSIDLEGASSIVSVLEEQGYYTIGTHSQPGVNYNRNTSYANLGFDRIYFQPDFVDLYNYGTRPRECDESVYQNFLRWQDETLEQWLESPVFIYNLTFQNHGAYNMLTDEWYRIKILEDYGEYTPLINEYLTHLCEEVPVTGAYNTYFDADNQEYLYEEDNSYHDEVWKYLYMEYNNLDQLHRREELFRLQ